MNHSPKAATKDMQNGKPVDRLPECDSDIPEISIDLRPARIAYEDARAEIRRGRREGLPRLLEVVERGLEPAERFTSRLNMLAAAGQDGGRVIPEESVACTLRRAFEDIPESFIRHASRAAVGVFGGRPSIPDGFSDPLREFDRAYKSIRAIGFAIEQVFPVDVVAALNDSLRKIRFFIDKLAESIPSPGIKPQIIPKHSRRPAKKATRKRRLREKLTAKQEVVYREFKLGRTHAEIAQMFGISRQAVSLRLKRANEIMDRLNKRHRSVSATQTYPTGGRGEPLTTAPGTADAASS